ncbi:adhesin transport system outer membrane protein [Desulfobaculum xiamenense]|uniref:Adhesin transport system outer membrane protein n=1 Tax=Desulfobaculum xiamenense TaxID=995050 RepID=A0A846QRZ6_9BACT|nr:TolC family protein [Desulfobaculum xiamenense]NJB67439.1 adhesin transport system outer membrane protein [Desulfobaculum xiamenense]
MKRYILCAVALAGLCLCAAVDVQARTLGELLPDMLAEHERLQAATERQDAAYFRMRQAKAGWYPRLDLTGDVAKENIEKRGSALTSYTRNIEKLRATQLLWDFGRTNSLIDTNKAAWEQSEVQRVAVRQGLIQEGVTAYLNCIRFSKVLGYALQSEENIKRQTGIEESLVEKGAGLSSDVLQAKSQLAGAAALRVVAEGDLVNARNRFRAVFGHDVDEERIRDFAAPDVPYDLIPASLDDAIAAAVKYNPNLLMLHKNIAMSEQEIRRARSMFYPSFNAFGEYWRKENDSGTPEVKIEQRAGIEFNYNLYAGGGDVATLKAATHARGDATNTLRDQERLIEELVRVNWQNLLTARAKAEWFRNQANIEGEFLELARKERKLGNRSLLDVLTAEVSHNNALSGATSAEVDQDLAAFNLLYAMGELELDLFVR